MARTPWAKTGDPGDVLAVVAPRCESKNKGHRAISGVTAPAGGGTHFRSRMTGAIHVHHFGGSGGLAGRELAVQIRGWFHVIFPVA